MNWMKKVLCIVLALLLLCTGVPAVLAAEYTVSSTVLSVGSNKVTTSKSVSTTLYVFQPKEIGAYKVSVSTASATLTYWHGSKFFVTGLAETATDGTLTVECFSVGQSFLVGLSGVSSATITITEQAGYVPPEMVEFKPYVNVHTPDPHFSMPDETLARVDIKRPQTVVADAEGIYHLNTVDGPILYVNMCSAVYADLYACYHPSSGSGALYMHGRYEDENGKACGYEFLEAMRPYAEALDQDGYYYLTVDLATYIQCYGNNQGWFCRDFSPFPLIKQGRFIEESAWLVNAYYVPENENNRTLGLLQRYINGWNVEIDFKVVDLDRNGKLNNRDLGLLQQKLNGWDILS